MSAKPPRRVFPEHPNDIVCDTCPARAPWSDSPESTADRARFRGWRLFKGVSVTGVPLDLAVCPRCGNNAVPPPPSRNAVMEGQEDLLGLVLPVPEGKKKRSRPRRQAS